MEWRKETDLKRGSASRMDVLNVRDLFFFNVYSKGSFSDDGFFEGHVSFHGFFKAVDCFQHGDDTIAGGELSTGDMTRNSIIMSVSPCSL